MINQIHISLAKIYIFFIFWFLFFNFLPPIYVQQFSNNFAIKVSLLSVVFFSFGCFYAIGKIKKKTINIRPIEVWKYYYIYPLLLVLSLSINNLFTPLFAIISAQLIVKLFDMKKYKLAIIFLLLSSVILFNQYTRMFILMMYMYIFLYYYIKSKNFYILQIIILSCFSFFILIVMLYQRVFGKIDFSKIYHYISTASPAEIFQLTDNYFVYEAYLHVISYFPKIHDYFYGSSLIKPFLFWIPREIWNDKPEGLTTYLPKLFYGMTRGAEYSSGMTITGEFYANYGIYGVIVLSFFFGYISLYIAMKMIRPRNESELLLGLTYLVYFPHLMRGGISTSVTFIFLYYLLFLLFFRTKQYFKKIIWRL